MSYTAGYAVTYPRLVSTWTPGWAVAREFHNKVDPASSTIGTDVVIYVPIVVPVVCPVRRVWWANGASVTGDVDAGVYSDVGAKPGVLLVSSGATAASGTSALQFVDVTDTILTPGRYWLAIAGSGSTNMMRVSISAAFDAAFRYEETLGSSLPLPATATPEESTSQRVPLFGFATTASP
jgi:hypothetical protein